MIPGRPMNQSNLTNALKNSVKGRNSRVEQKQKSFLKVQKKLNFKEKLQNTIPAGA